MEERSREELERLKGCAGFEEAVATAPVLLVASFMVSADPAAAAAAAAVAERLAAASSRLATASAAIAKGEAGSGRASFGFPRGDSKDLFLAVYGLVTRIAIAGPASGSGKFSWPADWGGVMESV